MNDWDALAWDTYDEWNESWYDDRPPLRARKLPLEQALPVSLRMLADALNTLRETPK